MNGQNIGYTTQSTPPQVSTLMEFHSEIAVAAKNVAELCEQARQIADSVFGVIITEPTTDSPSGAYVGGSISASRINAGSGNAVLNINASSAPKVQSVRGSISDLHSVIAQLRRQVERLTCI